MLCFTGGVLATSCDVMDTKPMESYDEDLVWSSKETADAFVTEVYKSSVALYAGEYAYLESYTPNGIHSDLTNLDAFPTEVGMDRTTNMGFGYFANLRNCNLIIEKAAAAAALTEAQKSELIAEGHFLRSLVNFYQTLWEGRFVPIMKVLTPESTEDFKTPLTANVAESYKLVIDDMNAGIEGLPEESASGRVNKYVAYAFRCRAALQAYAYTKDASYLDMCIESANAVINSGKYTLSSNYGEMFQKAGAYDNEIILGYYRFGEEHELRFIQ